MSVLSLTFHCTENRLQEWEQYVSENLTVLTENLMDVEKYILSEVESEMINEGKNTNLLLVFDDTEKREDFLESELVNIQERISAKYGEDVIIFVTKLNPVKKRI